MTENTPLPAHDEAGTIGRATFGRLGEREVSLYTLTNAHGCVLKISNYGATVCELHVPDRSGQLADVVLGFESLAEYVASKWYFGCIVGRVANRIAHGAFELDGKSYQLAQNDPPHHLHGGVRGFHRGLWSAQPKLLPDGPALELAYVSPDGEEGYPGEVSAFVTYQLTNAAEFRIEMRAETDRTTLVNLAHHGYFNLAGHDSGSILAHELCLDSDEYTALGPNGSGVTRPVANSALDFRDFKAIGRDLAQLGNQPLGYDHNYIVRGSPNELRRVAELQDPRSGRVMTLESDQPGVQFYCGSFLDGSERGKGARYERYAGLCLETQKFPFAINVPSWKNQVILQPGEQYRQRMVHRFSSRAAAS